MASNSGRASPCESHEGNEGTLRTWRSCGGEESIIARLSGCVNGDTTAWIRIDTSAQGFPLCQSRTTRAALAFPSALELFQRPRPVVVQQPRHGAVGQQAAVGLARRTVVGLVARVDDALDRRCRIAGHGLPYRPCTAMPLRKAVTFSGNFSPVVLRQPLGPLVQQQSRRGEERGDLAVGQRLRQLQRRQPRGVQNLVGVGVADAAEEMRIGQRALERVILRAQDRARTPPRSARSTSTPPGSSAATSSAPRRT